MGTHQLICIRKTKKKEKEKEKRIGPPAVVFESAGDRCRGAAAAQSVLTPRLGSSSSSSSLPLPLLLHW